MKFKVVTRSGETVVDAESWETASGGVSFKKGSAVVAWFNAREVVSVVQVGSASP